MSLSPFLSLLVFLFPLGLLALLAVRPGLARLVSTLVALVQSQQLADCNFQTFSSAELCDPSPPAPWPPAAAVTPTPPGTR